MARPIPTCRRPRCRLHRPSMARRLPSASRSTSSSQSRRRRARRRSRTTRAAQTTSRRRQLPSFRARARRASASSRTSPRRGEPCWTRRSRSSSSMAAARCRPPVSRRSRTATARRPGRRPGCPVQTSVRPAPGPPFITPFLTLTNLTLLDPLAEDDPIASFSTRAADEPSQPTPMEVDAARAIPPSQARSLSDSAHLADNQPSFTQSQLPLGWSQAPADRPGLPALAFDSAPDAADSAQSGKRSRKAKPLQASYFPPEPQRRSQRGRGGGGSGPGAAGPSLWQVAEDGRLQEQERQATDAQTGDWDPCWCVALQTRRSLAYARAGSDPPFLLPQVRRQRRRARHGWLVSCAHSRMHLGAPPLR